MTKEKKKAKKKTLVTLLLDRSSSMSMVKEQTLEAFNGYVDELRASSADIRMSLVYFDYVSQLSLEKVYVAERVKKVPALTAADYHPRGSTPLLDAAAATIGAIETSLKGRDDVNVVLVIQTDGQENSSVEMTNESLRQLIAQKEEQGWQFIFMGCGIDAYGQAGALGLSRGKTLSYGSDREATKAAFAATAANTRSYAEGISMNTEYSAVQKASAGDVYDSPVSGAAPSVPGSGSVVSGSPKPRSVPSSKVRFDASMFPGLPGQGKLYDPLKGSSRPIFDKPSEPFSLDFEEE